MLVSLLVAILGVAVGLYGAVANNYPLLVVGVVAIVASVFWFIRTRQESPVISRD